MQSVLNIKKIEKKFVDRILTWNEVSEIHRSRNGIYQKNGRLISLLTDFGKHNPCYPDASGDGGKTLFYTGAGRRGDQKLDAHNRALLDAVESGHLVPLFNKLAVGRWQFLGFWQVTKPTYIYDEKNRRMIWQFVLKSEQSAVSSQQIFMIEIENQFSTAHRLLLTISC